MHRLFPSQQAGEKIYLVVRQHWVYLAFKLIIWLIFVAAIIMFKTYVPGLLPNLFTGVAGQITALFEQVYGLFLLLVLFLIWVFYYLNMQIITNLRIVDVSQEGLFSHEVAELHIDKIEDVTSQVHGILGTLFDYGYVYVQTAGTIERFEFENVPHPAKLEKLILDLYEIRPKGKE